MTSMNAEQFAKLIQVTQQEFSLVLNTMRDKGMPRFYRTFAVGGLSLFFSYYFVFLPPGKKMLKLERQISSAKAAATYADQYKDMRDRLNAIYGQLPPISGRDRWLTNAVLDSMKAENLMSDSIVPPAEDEDTGFVMQRLTVTVQLKFSELMSWLVRIENNKPLMHIGSVELSKKTDVLGTNSVSVEIGTVIPSRRPGQQ